MPGETLEVLRHMSFLRDISEAALEEVAGRCLFRDLPANAILFRRDGLIEQDGPHVRLLDPAILLAAAMRVSAQTVEFGGQVRPRYEARGGRAVADDAHASLRTRLRPSAEIAPAARALIELQDVRIMGEELNTLTDFRADNLDIHQAYIDADVDALGPVGLRPGFLDESKNPAARERGPGAEAPTRREPRSQLLDGSTAAADAASAGASGESRAAIRSGLITRTSSRS